MHTKAILSQYPLISDQVDKAELSVLLTELEKQLIREVSGSVVEFGCYLGTTSLFIRRLLDIYKSQGQFHVYDSFAGLPQKTKFDESPAGIQFKAGELTVSKNDFIRQFKKAGLRLPYIHKSWFSELTTADIPDNIIFAYLDGDFYESIRDSLNLIKPKLEVDGVIVVDDYANEALPGVSKAVDEWCHLNKKDLTVRANSAFISI